MAKYWVGGGGTWNNNSGNRWSYYSGGPGGYGNPSSGEDAIFDANSGGGTVQVATGRSCYNLILNGFTGTFTGARSTSLPIYGTQVSLTGPSGVSMPGNGPVLYLYNNVTLYTNGSTIGDMVVPSTAYSLTLGSNVASKNNTTLTNNGTFNGNGYNIAIGQFLDNYSLNMGSGLWQVMFAGSFSAGQVCWQKAGPYLNASTSILRFVRARASGCLNGGISDSSTSLTLVDAYLDNNQTAWPSSGTIQIDNEIISYSSSSGGSKNVTLSGLTRHLNNTAPASHGSGAVVLLLGLAQTTLSSAAQYYDGYIYVNDTTNFQGDGWLEVGGEMIYYVSKPGNYFSVSGRGQTGYGGTSAAYHAAGTIVRQAEYRVIYLDLNGYGLNYNIVELQTNGGYMYSNFANYGNMNTLRAGPYLPANPIGMQYVYINPSYHTISNFQLAGQRGTQGLPSQPVYINGVSGANTSTTIYYSGGYPGPSTNMPYTYVGGDSWDFDLF